MKKVNSTIWLIATFIIGTIIGSGTIWQWQRLKLDKSNNEIASISNILELRKEIGNIHYEIIKLSEEYIAAKNSYENNRSSELHEKFLRLQKQIELKKDDFAILEKRLAVLENREPRSITITLAPPKRPESIRIDLKVDNRR